MKLFNNKHEHQWKYETLRDRICLSCNRMETVCKDEWIPVFSFRGWQADINRNKNNIKNIEEEKKDFTNYIDSLTCIHSKQTTSEE